MSIAPILRPRIVVMFALALILAVSAYGLAAANTVTESGAGDGNNDISGYNVTSVTYVLNSTTPSDIDSVSFSVAPIAGAAAPTHVQVQLVTSGVWFPAVHGSGTTWSVDLTAASPTITALEVDNLRVVAAQ